MGVYVDLRIKALSLLEWKNYFDRETLGLFFTDDDLIITDNVKYDEEDLDEEPHTEYRYSTTVQKAIDRLNAAGYTLSAIKKEFEEKKHSCLDYFSLLYDLQCNDDEYDAIQSERTNKYVTFQKWYNSVWKYAKLGLEHGLHLHWKKDIDMSFLPKNECDKLVYRSLKDGEKSYFGCLFSEFSPINTIRMILEKCSREEELSIDITEMIDWTYTSIEDMRIGDPTEKTIILLEGTNDKEILEFALKMIYPHLYNLYYFMDFEFDKVKKRRGGVDTISNNMKAFIYSKLKSRFIALYDNDTAGTQALKKLCFEVGEMPDNCRALHYPDIARAKRYPTIGINGKTVLDNINGRACSIEIYLPDFIIKNGTEYPPIEWGNRMKAEIAGETLNEYQGKVLTKPDIETRVKKYKNALQQGEKTFDVAQWSDIKKILDAIIHAFD